MCLPAAPSLCATADGVQVLVSGLASLRASKARCAPHAPNRACACAHRSAAYAPCHRDGSKPISGGIPHCFPQFGPGAIQQHGFARNLDWEVAEQSESSVVFRLTENDYTLEMWPYAFEAKVPLGEAATGGWWWRARCSLTIVHHRSPPGAARTMAHG